MSSNVKNRIQELNNRLADTLVEKGIDASGQETTTELIEKVGQFQPGGIPEGYIKPEGSMDITENGTFDVTEKAEVNVQVVAKPEKPYIDSSKLKYGAYMFSSEYGTDLSLLENIDTSEMLDMQRMFSGRTDLVNVKLDTKNCKRFDYTFNGCSKLEECQVDTRNGTHFQRFLFSCVSLLKLPELDFSEAVDINTIFQGCINADNSVYRVNAPKVTNMQAAFSGTNKIQEVVINAPNCKSYHTAFTGPYTVTFEHDIAEDCILTCIFQWNERITTVNGIINAGEGKLGSMAFYSAYNLQEIRFGVIKDVVSMPSCSKLSIESAKSIITALYDYSGTEKEFKKSVQFSSATLKLLEAEGATAPNGMTWIDYAINKGWNV